MLFSFEETRDLITSKLDTWIDGIISMIPNFLLAILVFAFFVLFAKLAKKTV